MMHQKPANVFVTSTSGESILKIGDFGFAKAISETSENMDTVLGTQSFIAPEIRQFKPYTTAVDIWGVGCIFLELLSDKTFDYSYEWAVNGGATVWDSIQKRYNNESETSQMLNIIKKLMDMNPSARPSATQMLRYLEENFIVDDNVSQSFILPFTGSSEDGLSSPVGGKSRNWHLENIECKYLVDL